MSNISAEIVCVRIIPPNEKAPGQLAQVELIFGVEAGTFPARQYSVNGERRSFALLRPMNGDASAQEAVRDLILEAYSASEGQTD